VYGHERATKRRVAVASSTRGHDHDEARYERHERHEARHDTSVGVRRTTTRHDAHERRRGTRLTTSVVRRSRHEATHDAHDDARYDERDATRVRHDERGATLRRAWCDARCEATRCVVCVDRVGSRGASPATTRRRGGGATRVASLSVAPPWRVARRRRSSDDEVATTRVCGEGVRRGGVRGVYEGCTTSGVCDTTTRVAYEVAYEVACTTRAVYEGGVRGWCATRVVCYEGGVLRGWCATRVVCYEGGGVRGWCVYGVVVYEGVVYRGVSCTTPMRRRTSPVASCEARRHDDTREHDDTRGVWRVV
jgi:hypothetical protein